MIDRGSGSVVAMLLVAVFGVGTIGLGSVTMLYGARAHAAAAADAAALAAAVGTYPPAGADEPFLEARRYARMNGAVAVSCDCPIDWSIRSRVATVIVELKIKVPFFGVREVRAGGRAEFDPRRWLGR